MTDTSAPWTEDQVRALAPDASSVAAARKLASRWRDTGAAGNAVWGLCQGSGAKPYQTIVDLSGPAYKCSCPSRKFPCKHALSLLLAWSSGAVPTREAAADFAAEWLAGRAAKATAAPKAKSAPSAAAVEQRRGRVAAGLAELHVWLTDQVRTGLAQTDRSFAAYEAVAARMVDAQAPRIAEALRRLPSAVATTEHWPELLLREYARLHLLVLAHRTLDALPEPLQAGIRSHIGYPVQAETVLAEPAVRDRWQVLGMRVSEEERLHARRTWLRGRSSGRWALLIEHSFGTPNFTGEVPAPGNEVDADLHYYPGPVPLRVQWGARHGAPEPFTTVPATGTAITDVLDAYAAALGADPLVRSVPALLTEVVPAVDEHGWHLVDAEGTALPLPAGVRPWRLLAVSGGHPVTVAGQWSAEGLDPVSVFSAGETHDLDTDFPTDTAASPELAELVSVALLGTARRGLDGVHLDSAVADAVPQRGGDPATKLLETAALQDLYLRGGRVPGTAPKPEPAVDDPRPLLPRRSADRLSRLLTEKSAFLPEWFAAAEPFDYRLPDVLCVQALSAASDPALRAPLLRLAGRRGRWLAARNPAWSKLVDEFPVDHTSSGKDPAVAGAHATTDPAADRAGSAESPAAQDIWLFGTPGERRDWLANLRRVDPARGLEALTTAWPKESGPIKAELLGLLAIGAHAADEALLERALDDRRGDVRRTATGLLARLPDSAYGARMTALLTAWLRIGSDGGLEVRVPADVGAEARRDGITDGTDQPKLRWDNSDASVQTLHQVVAAAPLSAWTRILRTTPENTAATALALSLPVRYAKAIVDGWVDAALAARDTTWARELFARATPTEQAVLRRRELFTLLDPADRVEHVLDLDAHQLTELHAILPGLDHPWPDRVAAHVLRLLGERARTTSRQPHSGAGVYTDRALLTAAGVHLPVDLAARVTALAEATDDPAWHQAFRTLATDLTERATMLEELS
ncbi:SWIM zinc finger family protein [Nocardia caishijiensis]|uniref:SWIM zinc finger protein n=1 Tax=Nocardia caishijiensis TaxID=184756 RepID=A0ABQ6YKB8_9NOCA|nr:SWIM zinc finger family protein [Nocardia caishijiensis]KAF0846240.1 SWIM zinc finger protein [Nocardia caishijiensis]